MERIKRKLINEKYNNKKFNNENSIIKINKIIQNARAFKHFHKNKHPDSWAPVAGKTAHKGNCRKGKMLSCKSACLHPAVQEEWNSKGSWWKKP